MINANPVVKYLIYINAALWLFLSQETVVEHGFVPAHPTVLTIFTSMFLHAGLVHVFFNMSVLHALDDMEEEMGTKWFVGTYLTTGLVAVLFHYITNFGSEIPMVGASGAISGLIGASAVLLPEMKSIGTINPFVWQWFTKKKFIINPTCFNLAKWFLIINVTAGIIGSITSDEKGAGVAWWAHVGGLLAGYGIAKVFDKLYPPDEENRPFDEPIEKNLTLRNAWGIKE